MKDGICGMARRMETYALRNRIPNNAPVIVRINGRAFKRWEKLHSFSNPFDKTLRERFEATTREVAHNFSAAFAHVWQDEINIFIPPRPNVYGGGSEQKIASDAASVATAAFARPEDQFLLTFDAFVFAVPDRMEAINYLMVRCWKARISSVDRVFYMYEGHAQGLRRTTDEKIRMLAERHHVYFDLNFFEEETMGRVLARRALSLDKNPHLRETLPPAHAAHTDPSISTIRTFEVLDDVHPISRIENPIEVFFEGADIQRNYPEP